MKKIRNSFIACASIVLALSACSVGDPSASPIPDNTPVITSEASADEDSDPNENNSVKNLDDTIDPDAISCDEPGIECDDYGNVLEDNRDELEDPVKEESKTTDDDEKVLLTPAKCDQTYPGQNEGGQYFSSFALNVFDENWNYDFGTEFNWTISDAETGELLLSCEGRGDFYGWGYGKEGFPPLRVQGEIKGQAFDGIVHMNPHYGGMNGEKIYESFMIRFTEDGSIELYEGSNVSPDRRWPIENAA